MIKVDKKREIIRLEGDVETLLNEFGNAFYRFFDSLADVSEEYAKFGFSDLLHMFAKVSYLFEKKRGIDLNATFFDDKEEKDEPDNELLDAMEEALSKIPPDKLRSIIKSMFEDNKNRKEKK